MRHSTNTRLESRVLPVEVKTLVGLEIQALDGKVGTIDELLFDDEFWTVRYYFCPLAGLNTSAGPTAA